MRFNYSVKKTSLRGLFYLFPLLFIACNSGNKESSVHEYIRLKGNAQGTTFSIIYDSDKVFDQEIDSILNQIDLSLSTYRSDSRISALNNGTSAIMDTYFFDVYSDSYTLYKESGGAFNPAVGPLISYWGFDEEKLKQPSRIDTQQINSIKAEIKLESLRFVLNNDTIRPDEMKYISTRYDTFLVLNPMSQKLNFNAIAQGYSVDVIAAFLSSQKVENYLVELGGEMRVKGVNDKGQKWRAGVDKPFNDLTEREIKAEIELNNQAIATSGSYRKFYEIEGIKYSHTINPETGFPVRHSLLSVTIIHPNCGFADGLATTCMTIGLEKSIALINQDEETLGYFIYQDGEGNLQTWKSEGLAIKEY